METPTQVFFCEICEILRIPILKNICKRLLLYFHLALIIIFTIITFTTIRSSRSQMFYKTSVLKNFENFTGKYLCWSLFLIELQTYYYYMNLIKLLNMGNVETTIKFSRLKSISSIEDNYSFTL